MALEKLMSSFNRRIADLQELMVVRGDGSRAADLAALNVSLQAIEHDLRTIDSHVKSETEALTKAKALNEMSLQQSKKLQIILDHFPSALPPSSQTSSDNSISGLPGERAGNVSAVHISNGQVQNAPKLQEKKGRGLPPRRYVSEDELASLSSYMRGRISLDKVNAAVDEMATFAEANSRLIMAPRKKLGDDILDKVLELRDIAGTEQVKGKHFFLESDMRGPLLKLDTTGKAILTILRHLGRVLEVRVGKHRVLALTTG